MSDLKAANLSLRNHEYADAIIKYVRAYKQISEYNANVKTNLLFAQQRYRKDRLKSANLNVIVCCSNLTNNYAGRAITLADIYKTFSDVKIVGCVYSRQSKDIWTPIRNTAHTLISTLIEDESKIIDQAIDVVLSNPADLVHLSKPLMPNIVFGLLYKLIWGARVIVDIDSDELLRVNADETLTLEEGLRLQKGLATRVDLLDQTWTRVAVGLAKTFDGITVVNPALQSLYGGTIIRHARDSNIFNPSAFLRARSRKKLDVSKNTTLVLFLGTPQRHSGILESAKAMASLRSKAIVYMIVGTFPKEEQILKEELLAVKGLSIRFLDDQPFEDIPDILAAGDICILLQDPATGSAPMETPAKLSDAAGMGLTILGSITDGTKDLADSGLFVPVSLKSLPDLLKQVINQKVETPKQVLQFRELLSVEANAKILQNQVNTVNEGESISPPIELRSLLDIFSREHPPSFIEQYQEELIKQSPSVQMVPKFSICIPFYNGVDTIENCIKSIREQFTDSNTVPWQQADVEIIVTSDNTSFEVMEFLEGLSKTYNIKLYHNAERLGSTRNWQRALSLANGEIVTLLHDDDYYNPGCLTAIYEWFEKNPKAYIVQTNAMLVYDANFGRAPHPQFKRDSTKIIPSKEFLPALFNGYASAPTSTFFRRVALETQKIYYDSRYVWCPELDLYWRLAGANPDGEVVVDHRTLVSRGLSLTQYSRYTSHLQVKDYLSVWEGISSSTLIDEVAKAELKCEFINYLIKPIIATLNACFDRDPFVMRQRCKSLKEIAKDMRLGSVIESDANTRQLFIDALVQATKGKPEFPLPELLHGSGMHHNFAEGYSVKITRSLDRAIVQNALPKQANDSALDAIFYKTRDFILQSEYFNEPVIICGFHHSGTRLLAQLLESIGVFQVFNRDSQEWDYTQWINMGLMPEWNDPKMVDNFNADETLIDFDKERLGLRLSVAGYLGYSPWGFKDPRNMVTLSYWLQRFPNAKVILIKRDPVDVLGTLPANQYARYTPNGVCPHDDMAFWVSLWKSYHEAFNRHVQKAKYYAEIKYEQLCKDPLTVLRQLSIDIKLDCNPCARDLEDIEVDISKIQGHIKWLGDKRLKRSLLKLLETLRN